LALSFASKSFFEPYGKTLSKFLPPKVDGKYCVTEDIWKWKQEVLKSKQQEKQALACLTEGVCDEPTYRNRWTNGDLEINLIYNIMCFNLTNGCPFQEQRIIDQTRQINIDFAGTGLRFKTAEVNFVANQRLAEISPYGNNPQWYYDILEVKEITAKRPLAALNIFVTKQRQGASGTLLGIGTFPWDPESKTVYGGLWMNANYIGIGEKTASHEIGHNIGLWHTFHGINEVGCSSDCYERVHNESDSTSAPNYVGDFCADTPSQPMNYNCISPSSRDCFGTLFTNITGNLISDLVNNFMAYTPDSCMQKFSAQQNMRAFCWTCKELPGWDAAGCAKGPSN